MSRDNDHHIPFRAPDTNEPLHSPPGPRRRECNPQLFPHETNDSLTSAAHYRGNLVSVVFLITRKPMLLLLFIIYVTRCVCAVLIAAADRPCSAPVLLFPSFSPAPNSTLVSWPALHTPMCRAAPQGTSPPCAASRLAAPTGKAERQLLCEHLLLAWHHVRLYVCEIIPTRSR